MLENILWDVVSLVVVGVLPFAVRALFKLLGVREDSNAAQAINLAVERGAAYVYQSMVLKGISPADKAAYDALVATATTRVVNRIGRHATRFGVTADEITGMIEDSFGKHLVADPNVRLPN